MNGRGWKRLTALLLVLLMALTLLPASVAKADNEITVIVGIVAHMNQTGYQVRCFNNSGLEEDANCVSTGKSVRKNVGYWGEAQTFNLYTAKISAASTGWKVHNGDTWFGENATLQDSTAFVFEYSNVFYATYTRDHIITIDSNITNGAVTADKVIAAQGDTVTLTVTPDAGYQLDTLTVKDAQNNTVQVSNDQFSMPDSNVTVTATFTAVQQPVPYILTTAIIGSGTVVFSGNGVQTAADTTVTADSTSIVTVTVKPESGYKLRGLKVDGIDMIAQSIVTVYNDPAWTSAHSGDVWTAQFKMPAHNVKVEAVFETVVSGEHFIYVVTDGLGTAFADKQKAARDEKVTITTEDDIGYVYKELSVNGEAAQTSKTFDMPDADAFVKVEFAKTVYKVNLVSDPQGTLNAIPRNNGKEYAEAYANTTVEIIVIANEEYVVDSVKVYRIENNTETEITNNNDLGFTPKPHTGKTWNYTFTMPAYDVTVKATYKRIVTDGYYLIGPNGWTVDTINPEHRFSPVSDLNGDWMHLVVDLTAGQEFKAVKVTNGTIDTWYPASGGNLSVSEGGRYVITLRKEGTMPYGDGWHLDTLRAVKIENEYYLVNINVDGNGTNQIRTQDKLYINTEFNENDPVKDDNNNDSTLRKLYGVDHEHMVLTYLNSSDKIKVVNINGDESNQSNWYWYPGEAGTEYPYYIYNYPVPSGVSPLSGMVFVFFEEQLGKDTSNPHKFRPDWTNKVFDVQKAYKVDMDGKVAYNPLNKDGLTYNLEHGSVSLSTGTAFMRTDTNGGAGVANTIYELYLSRQKPNGEFDGQRIDCTVTCENGYVLDGTPYYTIGTNTAKHSLEGSGKQWYFYMKQADITLHFPMKTVFRTQSALLSGRIGINFFVDLSDYPDKTNIKMKFTVGNDTTVQEVPFDSTFLNQSKKFHGFTCMINAFQMAEPIHAKLYNGDMLISQKDYSLQDYVTYFDRTDATEAENNIALKLIRSMLDYGYYLQQFANQGAKITRHYANQFDCNTIQQMTESYALNGDNLSIAGTEIENVTLSLGVNSSTDLIVYLYMKNDTAPTISSIGSGRAWSLSREREKVYKLTISGISAHDLRDIFEIQGNANGAFTIKAAALSYVYQIMSLYKNVEIVEGDNDETKAEKQEKINLRNCAAALYEFHKAEVAYRKASGQDD